MSRVPVLSANPVMASVAVFVVEAPVKGDRTGVVETVSRDLVRRSYMAIADVDRAVVGQRAEDRNKATAVTVFAAVASVIEIDETLVEQISGHGNRRGVLDIKVSPGPDSGQSCERAVACKIYAVRNKGMRAVDQQ